MKKKENSDKKICKCGRIITNPDNKTGICPICFNNKMKKIGICIGASASIASSIKIFGSYNNSEKSK